MTSVLNSYLVQHRSLSIPGLGTIWIQPEPASKATEGGEWLPPAVIYRIDKFQDTPEKEFFHFLAEHRQIPEYEAIKEYNEFTAAFCLAVRTKEEARWEGVGIFKMDPSGEIVIEQIAKPFLLFTPIEAAIIRAAEPLTRQEEASSGEVITPDEKGEDASGLPEGELRTPAPAKRRWLMLVIALLVIILLVLLIYFYRNGYVWHSLFNQQSVF